MVRNLALVVVLAAAGIAHANGRPPGTSTINFRQGHPVDVLAGMTFGLVITHDGGATWHWMCEKAVLYGGLFDPDYAYSASGAVFATTFDGSLVMRDGCVFEPTQFGKKFFSSITLGPDGHLLMAAAETPDTMGNPGDAKIYRSVDDGGTFPVSATAGEVNDWYNSIEVAPSDASRVYLSGYRITGGVRSWQIYKSTNGGTSYTPVTSTGFTTSENSAIDIVGIGKTDPNLVFVKVSLTNGNIADAIWRSTNAGQSWTKVLDKPDELAFVVRANGDLVAGSRTAGAFVSHNNGDAWTPLANAPHMNCLAENAQGEVWACTQNYAVMSMPSDDAGIMKSTDLATWTTVLRYQDIAGPVDCPAGTRQHDQCVYDCLDDTYNADPNMCPNVKPSAWCALKTQLGITSSVLDCPAVTDDLSPVDDAGDPKPKDKGCCETGDSSGVPAIMAIGLAVGTVVLRRRRRA